MNAMIEQNNSKIDEIFTLALQNHQKNSLSVAEDLYKKILHLNPNHFEAIFNLGTLFVQTKNFNESKPLLKKAIEIQPNHSAAYVNLGIVFEELEETEEAIKHFQKALEIDSNFVVAHFNLGNIFYKLDKFENAIECYEKAIQIKPNHILAYNNLGLIYKDLEKPLKALEFYKKAILIDPNYKLAVNNVSILLKETRLLNLTKENSLNIKELILLLFKRNDINHKDIFRNARKFLFLENNIKELNEIISSNKSIIDNILIKKLLEDELFYLILQKSLIADQFIEKILIKLRYEILFLFKESNKIFLKKNINFIISLAEQCFLNEYIYIQSKKETDYLNLLINEETNDKEIDEIKIAILGCYIPLKSNKNIEKKIYSYKSKNILFNDLINMQVREPLKELKIISSIKSLNKISDDVSKKVRSQYEEYPYPRWRFTYSNSPNSFLKFVKNQIKPNKVKINYNFKNPKVLIAGCGTGNHICQAANYLNSTILGIDLSLSSLAYAKRKIEELNLKNIEFLHADILQLNDLNKKFDVIESVGVLHHMDDPLKGLKILKDLLEPHGFLLLGLYSEKAREEVIRAKEYVKKKNFGNSFIEIRKFREAIFNEKNDILLQALSKGKDFYSTSSIKDLVFHTKEHRFSLPQIFNMIENLNLEFLGFCDSKIKKNYLNQFPDDPKNISPENWNQFESLNPRSFAGMYKFWLRKK